MLRDTDTHRRACSTPLLQLLQDLRQQCLQTSQTAHLRPSFSLKDRGRHRSLKSTPEHTQRTKQRSLHTAKRGQNQFSMAAHHLQGCLSLGPGSPSPKSHLLSKHGGGTASSAASAQQVPSAVSRRGCLAPELPDSLKNTAQHSPELQHSSAALLGGTRQGLPTGRELWRL